MKRFFLIAGIGSLFLAVSCQHGQKPLLSASLEGMASGEAYVGHAAVPGADTLCWDTVAVTDGKFVWDRPIGQLTRVEIELKEVRDRLGLPAGEMPAAFRIGFLVNPGESVRMRAECRQDGILYRLEGSPQLSAQSAVRAASREIYPRMQAIESRIEEALENGIENADEMLIDSLSSLYDKFQKEVSDKYLEFVRDFPDDMRSAYYLLEYPVKDTFLSYYERLGKEVREGAMGTRLEEMREKAIRLSRLAANARKVQAGAVAPDFEMKDLNGRTFRLSDYADRYVVLDFWGTWCPWCLKGLPKMKEYHARYASKVEFIGISNRDKEQKLKEFVKKEGLLWTNALNAQGGNPDVVLMYGVSGYPTKILLAPGLKVVERYMGEVPAFYQALDDIR